MSHLCAGYNRLKSPGKRVKHLRTCRTCASFVADRVERNQTKNVRAAVKRLARAA